MESQNLPINSYMHVWLSPRQKKRDFSPQISQRIVHKMYILTHVILWPFTQVKVGFTSFSDGTKNSLQWVISAHNVQEADAVEVPPQHQPQEGAQDKELQTKNRLMAHRVGITVVYNTFLHPTDFTLGF